jgi:hypothetical protein
MGLSEMVAATHECEEKYAELRQHKVVDPEIMVNDLDKVESAIEKYQALINKYFSSMNIDEKVIKLASTLDQKRSQILQFKEPSALGQFMQPLVSILQSESIDEIIGRCRAGLGGIAHSLNKPEPDVIAETDIAPQFSEHQINKLEDILNHMFKNSLDHGIEAPDLRRSKAKPEKGLIKVSCYVCNEQNIVDNISRQPQGENVITISFSDDGAGLNIAAIRKKFKVQSDEDCLQTILKSGASTAEKVTDISGRGVGMDAVASMLKEELNGELKQVFVGGKTGDERRPFEVRLHFPVTEILKKLPSAKALESELASA